MFKILTLAIGFYFLYRLMNNSRNLESGTKNPPLEDEDGEYVDYEEVE